MGGDSVPMQMISDKAELDLAALQRFSDSVELHKHDTSYVVVAIIGPQSSGKSTLINYLFGTNFSVMDAKAGVNQTTKGIWIAEAVAIKPLTLVMDLEGADSQNQNDPAFEKQIAMFAVAVADILVINIWCHDIGRNTAASNPLLSAVFKGMMRKFRPRKTTLLYVIRDITETPFEYLEQKLRMDIQEIWKTLPNKPPAYEDDLSEYFNVEVTALPHYKYEKEEFKEQVTQLRRKFFMRSTSPEGLACNRQSVVPASAFCSNIKLIWKTIKEDKDLDLPAQGILEAKSRCEDIANQTLHLLASDKDWLDLEQEVNADPGAVSGFGKTVTEFLKTYLLKYDEESLFYDEAVRNDKRQNLKSKAIKEVVYPCYEKLLRHLSSVSFESFKIELEEKLCRGETGFAAAVRECHVSCIYDFDQRCSDATVEEAKWDASKLLGEKLEVDMEAHASVVSTRKLSELVDHNQEKLRKAVVKPVESLFETGGSDTWASIRDLLKSETNKAVSELLSAMDGFELEQQTVYKMVGDLKEYATDLVKDTSRKRADLALHYIRDRFSRAAMYDEDGRPWDQNRRMKKKEVEAIMNHGYQECLKLLAAMAVIRLEERTVDSVENLLLSSLMPAGSSADRRLDSKTWDGVPPENTLITPIKCTDLWVNYMAEIAVNVTNGKILYGKGGNGSKTFWWVLGRLTVSVALSTIGVLDLGVLLDFLGIVDIVDSVEIIHKLYHKISEVFTEE